MSPVSAERTYRRLCRLLPAELWREAESDLVAVFREEFSRVAGRSALARARFWMRLILDTVITAAAERTAASSSALRSGRLTMWFGSIPRDVRHALRLLRRHPANAVLAIATLAIGIGAATALSTLVDAILVRPLPYEDAAALVKVSGVGTRVTGRPVNLSVPDFLDLSRDARSIATLGAFGSSIGWVTVAEPDGAERIRGVLVSAGFFAALRVEPLLGRVTTGADDLAAANVAVISNGWWRRRFGADPGAIGQTIRVGNTDQRVVGVLRPDFRYPQPDPLGDPDIYGPIATGTPGPRSTRTIRAIGRLAPGRTVGDAQTDLSRVAADLEHQFTTEDANTGVTVTPLREALVGNVAPVLWLGLGFAGAVLAIGCLNIAMLSLARNLARRQELAVRTALGAGRGRLVRQMLTEALVSSGLGCVIGWAVGAAALRGLIALAHDSLPRADDVHLDGRVLIVTAALSVVAAVVAGLVPALRAARSGIEASLRRTGRSGGAALGPLGRRLLIGGEAMLSTALLVGAALVGQSFWHLVHVDPGFAPTALLTAQVGLPVGRYPAGTWARFDDELRDRAASRPGIEGVAVTSILPLSGSHSCDALQIERHPAAPGHQPCAETRIVSANYFDVMRIAVVSGRRFAETDREGGANVVIVNEAMAKHFWPGESAVGQRVTLVAYGASETTREVVGVVRNTTHLALSESAVPQVFVPDHQPPGSPLMTIVVRSSQPTAATAAILRAELAAIDPRVPLYNVRTLDQLISTSVSLPRLQTVLSLVCAAIACGLTMIGVYGVLSETVAQRVREIGTRLCLGASRRDVASLVVGQVFGPVAAGAALGLAVAWLAVRWSAATFYGLTPTDARTFIGVPLALVLAALFTTVIPIGQALNVSPSEGLRGE